VTAPETSVKRHPIRGVLYGLLMGVGVALILGGRAIVAFGSTKMIIVVVVFAVAGGLWGAFAPAKKPKTDKPPDPPMEAKVQPSGEAAEAGDSAEPETDGEAADSSE
jgi:hypothetical protein